MRQTVKQLQCLRRGRRAGQHVKHRPCRQGGGEEWGAYRGGRPPTACFCAKRLFLLVLDALVCLVLMIFH